jgi:hypothetical protein
MKKIIVDGLKNNIILDNNECVVGLFVCLSPHLSVTELFVCTKFSVGYLYTVNMRLIITKIKNA